MTATANGLEQIQPSVPAPRPLEVGQATAVEQSRALAEVQAAVYVARQFPRDIGQARADMLDACAQMALAERSSFSFRRAGQAVTGPSIHMARELARCWGNIQYGLTELSRDDVNGSSQMIAFAWDVQTNARSSSTFIVPHVRDTKDGARKLTETRDIYENNANQGARRVREAIFGVLPTWFVEEAKLTCRKTLEDGGGKPLVVRIEEMIAAFALAHITVTQLEARVGTAKADWTVQEVATLGVVFTSLRNGETTRDDEFPPLTPPVTTEEVAGQKASPRRTRKTTETPPADPAVTQALIDEIYSAAAAVGLTDGDIEDDFAQHNEGIGTAQGTPEQLQAYLDSLRTEAAAQQ